jgi:hypothetical protein
MILVHVVQRAADVGCFGLLRDVVQQAGILRQSDHATNLNRQDAVSRFMKYISAFEAG